MCSSSTGALEGHSTHLHVGRSDLHFPLDPPAGGLQMAHSFEHIPVLRDEVVDEVVKAILTSAQTGKIGDGKIFLSRIDEAIRIRNEEHGSDAL